MKGLIDLTRNNITDHPGNTRNPSWVVTNNARANIPEQTLYANGRNELTHNSRELHDEVNHHQFDLVKTYDGTKTKLEFYRNNLVVNQHSYDSIVGKMTGLAGVNCYYNDPNAPVSVNILNGPIITPCLGDLYDILHTCALAIQGWYFNITRILEEFHRGSDMNALPQNRTWESDDRLGELNRTVLIVKLLRFDNKVETIRLVSDQLYKFPFQPAFVAWKTITRFQMESAIPSEKNIFSRLLLSRPKNFKDDIDDTHGFFREKTSIGSDLSVDDPLFYGFSIWIEIGKPGSLPSQFNLSNFDALVADDLNFHTYKVSANVNNQIVRIPAPSEFDFQNNTDLPVRFGAALSCRGNGPDFIRNEFLNHHDQTFIPLQAWRTWDFMSNRPQKQGDFPNMPDRLGGQYQGPLADDGKNDDGGNDDGGNDDGGDDGRDDDDEDEQPRRRRRTALQRLLEDAVGHGASYIPAVQNQPAPRYSLRNRVVPASAPPVVQNQPGSRYSLRRRDARPNYSDTRRRKKGKGGEEIKQFIQTYSAHSQWHDERVPELTFMLETDKMTTWTEQELALCGLRALYKSFDSDFWKDKEPFNTSISTRYMFETWADYLNISKTEGVYVEEMTKIATRYDIGLCIYEFDPDNHLLKELIYNKKWRSHPAEKRAILCICKDHYFRFRWTHNQFQIKQEKFQDTKKEWYRMKKLAHPHLHPFNDHHIIYFDFETHAVLIDNKKVQRPYYVCAKYVSPIRNEDVEYELGGNNDGKLIVDLRDVFCRKIMSWIQQRWDDLTYRTNSHHYNKMRSELEPLYLCAHNGSGFDMQYFVQWFASNGFTHGEYDSQITMKGSRIVLFTILRNGFSAGSKKRWIPILQMHDSYLVLMQSLDEAHKSFCSSAQKHKDLFPHMYFENHNATHIDLRNQIIKISVEDLPEKTRNGLTDDDKKLLENFDYSHRLHEYCWQDVNMLKEVYESFNKSFEEVAIENKWIQPGESFCILDFCTANKLAQTAALSALPEEYRWSHKVTKSERHVYSKMRLPNEECDEFIRKAILGGMVYPRTQFWQSHRPDISYPYDPETDNNFDEMCQFYKDNYDGLGDDYLICADFRSQYGSVLSFGKFPYGNHRKMTSTEIELLKKTYATKDPVFFSALPCSILEVDMENDKFDLQPICGYHKNDKSVQKLVWDNLRRKCHYSNIIVEETLKNNGTVYDVLDGVVFEKSGAVFSKFAKTCLYEKVKAKEQHRSGAETVYKLLSNSTFGGCLKQDYDTVHKIVMDERTKDKFLEKNNYQLGSTFSTVGFRSDLWEGKRKKESNWHSAVPSYIGVFVLDQAKWQLSTLIDSVTPSLYDKDIDVKKVLRRTAHYGDTDSLMLHCSSIPLLYEHNYLSKEDKTTPQRIEEQGLFGTISDDINKNFDEKKCNFARIIEAVFIAPKTYGVVSIDETKKISEKIRCKGVPKSAPIKVILSACRQKSNIKKLYKDDYVYAEYPKLCYAALRTWLHYYSMKVRSQQFLDVLISATFTNLHRINIRESTRMELLPMTIINMKMIRNCLPNTWISRPVLGNLRVPFSMVEELKDSIFEQYYDWIDNKHLNNCERPYWLNTEHRPKQKANDIDLPDMIGFVSPPQRNFVELFDENRQVDYSKEGQVDFSAIYEYVDQVCQPVDHSNYCRLSPDEINKLKPQNSNSSQPSLFCSLFKM